ncbi:MAG: diacylglycerol kinase family lipid kinase [Anaerolineaceae bacterium]|nr:diacylglycerol kinase family lipid kinase [Anaerolineaceae bacterium]
MEKYKVIVNPISGRGAGARSIDEIHEKLKESKISYDLVVTKQPWHAVELTKNAIREGYSVVVAVGGDGTANEVINGLMEAKQQKIGTAAMGMLTVGRGNDFAFSMNIPVGLDKSLNTLIKNKRRTIDIGHVKGGDYPQGRYFGNCIGIGFDAVVGFVAVKLKPLRGFSSYILGALMTNYIYFKPPRIKAIFDKESLDDRFLMISVMNGRRLGGGFMMAPDGIPDDGLFDVCVTPKVTKGKVLSLIPHFLKGDQYEYEPVRKIQTTTLKTTALEGSLPVHVDGETLCVEGQQLDIKIINKQIDLICENE